MNNILASYNRLSYLALSKEMLRLCDEIALESLNEDVLFPIVLMLVKLTCPVDWSKGIWCFDTSPLIGYTIGSNKHMDQGGG